MHSAKPLAALIILLGALAPPVAVLAQDQKSDTRDKQESGAVIPSSKSSTAPQSKQTEIGANHSRRSSPSRQTSNRSTRKHRAFSRSTPVSKPSSPAPVTLVTHSPEYISGEANVTVKGNENPIIRLGLARSGVTMVEFPASDRFFALHPGNSDMVTIDESPTKQNDHFFVFRAGSSFVSPLSSQASTGPSASVIAQMRSGMVVTLLIYPVRELSQMAHRVVILYDRAEVVAARRAAGLAVNLEENQQQQAQRSIRIAGQPDSPGSQSEPIGAENAGEIRPRTVETRRIGGQIDSSPLNTQPVIASGRSVDPDSSVKPDLDLDAEARKALKLAITTSKFKNWTRPSHGLSLATSNPKELNAEDSSAIVIVAVRNIIPEPLRIVPGQPDISIETRDDKGIKTVLVEQIKPLHVESSGIGDSIPAGAILYYAIVYRRPVLGVHQRLRVTIGQINAADDPAVVDLTTSPR